jgi:glycosyltransferase involved in cell wall biosynthesis
MVSTTRPTIGIALGGGAARGWAHIGVLKSLMSAEGEAEAIDLVASWMDGMFEWVADNSTNGAKERREMHIWEKTMGALNDIYCAMVGQKTRT